MTKKHYQFLAEAIRLSTDLGEKHLIHKDQLLTTLIPFLKKDNPQFDGFRFIEACNNK